MRERTLNYYRRYIGDYMRDTASLSIAEHGAYTLLLDYAYATERPIPGDRDEVLRMLRAFTAEERKAVDKVLARFWILGDDGYRNQRVEEELAKASKLIEKQKANGSLGGRPKKTQGETQIGTQNNQPPTTNHQPPSTTPQPPASNRQEKAKAEVAPLALPPWLNAETWTAYVKTRKAPARKPESLKGALKKLEAFRAEGFDPNEIVATSLANGWQGLFPPDAGRATKPNLADANRAAAEEATRRIQERG